jgi:hypothetical protein
VAVEVNAEYRGMRGIDSIGVNYRLLEFNVDIDGFVQVNLLATRCLLVTYTPTNLLDIPMR